MKVKALLPSYLPPFHKIDKEEGGQKALKKSKVNFINQIPNELFIKIFSVLPLNEISYIIRACHNWHQQDFKIGRICDKHFKSSLTNKLGKGKVNKIPKDKMNYISKVPNEILIEIFSFLSFDDLICAMRVCKNWNTQAYNDKIWKIQADQFKIDFNLYPSPCLVKQQIKIQYEQIKLAALRSVLDEVLLRC